MYLAWSKFDAVDDVGVCVALARRIGLRLLDSGVDQCAPAHDQAAGLKTATDNIKKDQKSRPMDGLHIILPKRRVVNT